jgi:hypothetical protein
MNVEIGAEAALFPEKEYISGIFVPVRYRSRGIFFIQKLDRMLVSLAFRHFLFRWMAASTDVKICEWL